MAASRVVEIELPSGQLVLAEVRTLGGAGVTDVGVLPRFSLTEAGTAIGEVAEWLMKSVTSSLPRAPEKVGIDFGIKLALKTGKLTSVLAEASGEATALVRLEWTNIDQPV